jgi:hypothetical protein
MAQNQIQDPTISTSSVWQRVNITLEFFKHDVPRSNKHIFWTRLQNAVVDFASGYVEEFQHTRRQSETDVTDTESEREEFEEDNEAENEESEQEEQE